MQTFQQECDALLDRVHLTPEMQKLMQSLAKSPPTRELFDQANDLYTQLAHINTDIYRIQAAYRDTRHGDLPENLRAVKIWITFLSRYLPDSHHMLSQAGLAGGVGGGGNRLVHFSEEINVHDICTKNYHECEKIWYNDPRYLTLIQEKGMQCNLGTYVFVRRVQITAFGKLDQYRSVRYNSTVNYYEDNPQTIVALQRIVVKSTNLDAAAAGFRIHNQDEPEHCEENPLNEIRILCMLSAYGAQPNIHFPALFHIVDRMLYVISPFVELDLLRYAIAVSKNSNNGPMSQAFIVQCLKEVGSALAFIHSRGIAHRDISHNNVLVYILPDGRVQFRLIDFGAARCLFLSGSENGRFSPIALEQHMGRYCASGKVPFCAPEVIRMHRVPVQNHPNFVYDAIAADSFSLACLMWFLMTPAVPRCPMAPDDDCRNFTTDLQAQNLVSIFHAYHYSDDLRVYVYNLIRPRPSDRWRCCDLMNDIRGLWRM